MVSQKLWRSQLLRSGTTVLLPGDDCFQGRGALAVQACSSTTARRPSFRAESRAEPSQSGRSSSRRSRRGSRGLPTANPLRYAGTYDT